MWKNSWNDLDIPLPGDLPRPFFYASHVNLSGMLIPGYKYVFSRYDGILRHKGFFTFVHCINNKAVFAYRDDAGTCQTVRVHFHDRFPHFSTELQDDHGNFTHVTVYPLSKMNPRDLRRDREARSLLFLQKNIDTMYAFLHRPGGVYATRAAENFYASQLELGIERVHGHDFDQRKQVGGADEALVVIHIKGGDVQSVEKDAFSLEILRL